MQLSLPHPEIRYRGGNVTPLRLILSPTQISWSRWNPTPSNSLWRCLLCVVMSTLLAPSSSKRRPLTPPMVNDRTNRCCYLKRIGWMSMLKLCRGIGTSMQLATVNMTNCNLAKRILATKSRSFRLNINQTLCGTFKSRKVSNSSTDLNTYASSSHRLKATGPRYRPSLSSLTCSRRGNDFCQVKAMSWHQSGRIRTRLNVSVIMSGEVPRRTITDRELSSTKGTVTSHSSRKKSSVVRITSEIRWFFISSQFRAAIAVGETTTTRAPSA